MRNTVVITDPATADIIEQFNYIRFIRQDPVGAERWLRGIYAAVQTLEKFSNYARARESDFLGVDLRQKIFKSHRIVFSVDEKKHEIVIHYVRHAARRAAGEPPEA